MQDTDAIPLQEHRFPCDNCGADFRFDPGAGHLTCDHCGNTAQIEHATPWAAPIKELDLRRALEQDLSRQQIESQRSYMMMLSILVTFLLFSLGTVLWLYRRQTRLNAELVIANEQAQIGQQTKERFIAVVGHELRTPLNPIINLCDVISQSLKDSFL